MGDIERPHQSRHSEPTTFRGEVLSGTIPIGLFIILVIFPKITSHKESSPSTKSERVMALGQTGRADVV